MIRFITFFVFLCIFIIICKLYYVQIAQGKEYREKAQKQYVKPQTEVFERGSIFFTSKDSVRIAAATVKEGYTVSINPKFITNPIQVYEALSQYLNIDKDLFLEKAGKTDDAYEEIQKKIDY